MRWRNSLPGTITSVPLLQGHELDEAHVEAALAGQPREVHRLVVVAVTHHHAVDAERTQPRGVRCVDPGHDLRVDVAPRQRMEVLRVQGVQAHVDAAQPGLNQGRRQALELGGVAGESQIPEPRDRSQLGDQAGQVLAQQRLAAGETKAARARGNRQPGDALDLLEAHQGLARQPLHVLGHAVEAAQVAAVGDRDPQVLDPALVAVREEGKGLQGHGVGRVARRARPGLTPGVGGRNLGGPWPTPPSKASRPARPPTSCRW
jgi:hypothetical protein